jgi:hypothetical protein
MTLLIDERTAPPGLPGIHALLVGISSYPHLDSRAHPDATLNLRSLESAALTAYRLCQWLIIRSANLYKPLLSCRLFVAPSKAEVAEEPALEGLRGSCDFVAFDEQAKAWRTAANLHKDNVALFYFAGHGLQKSHNEHLMLLADFADGTSTTLGKAVSGQELMNGMAPSLKRRTVAKTQVYFFDACRLSHRKIREVEKSEHAGLWDVGQLDTEDYRNVAVFHTALPGRRAFGRRGKQSIFSLALLDCLNGGAAEVMLQNPDGSENWGVSLSSLERHLRYHIDRLNRSPGEAQPFASERRGDVWLHRLERPPTVDVEVQLIPAGAEQHTALRLLDGLGTTVWDLSAPLRPHPYSRPVPAGAYNAVASVTRTNGDVVMPPQPNRADPPYKRWVVRT